MFEIKQIVMGHGPAAVRWGLYIDGELYDDYGSQPEAEAALAELRGMLQEARRPVVREEEGRWAVYGTNDLLIDTFDTEGEARAAAATAELLGRPVKSAGLITDRLRQSAQLGLQEATHTSVSLDEVPFVIDGVALSPGQVQRLRNLVAGTARPGPGQPVELPRAIELWRTQNHTRTLPSGRQVWTVHSASPTYREKPAAQPSAPVLEDEKGNGSCVESIRLVESRDPSGRVWDAVAIESGWSKNGKYYKPDALREAIPIFEGASVNAYGWNPAGRDLGHVPNRVRDSFGGASGLVLNKVGKLTGVTARATPTGGVELPCTFNCYEPAIATRLKEAWDAGDHDFLGLSIDANGDWHMGVAEGRRGQIVHRITDLSEVTLVTDPAAGGRFTRLVAGKYATEEPEMSKLVKFLRSRLPKALAATVDSMDPKVLAATTVEVIDGIIATKPFKKARLAEGVSDAAYLKIVRAQIDTNPEIAGALLDAFIGAESEEGEGPDQEDLAAQQAPGGMPGLMESVQKKLEAAAALEARLAEAEAKSDRRLKLLESQANMRLKLAESGLPPAAQKWLQETFAEDVLSAEDIDRAIASQRAILAEAHDAPHRMSGNTRTSITSDSRDKLQRRCDLIFDPELPARLRAAGKHDEAKQYDGLARRNGMAPSIKEIYLELTGDYNFDGIIERGRLQEATTADLPSLLSTSITKALVPAYEEYKDPLEPLVYINPNVDSFLQQDRVQFGGFGRLPKVAEGGTYQDLGIMRDEHSSYVVEKRGGTATITIEMVANDNLGALQAIPRELALAASNEEAYFRAGLITGNAGGAGINTDTVYDSLTVYHQNHRNLVSSPLGYNSLLDARKALRKQFKRGTSALCSMNYMAGGTTLSNLDSTAKFKAGDFFQLDAEIFRISSVDSSTQFTVAGGQLGTVPANHDGSGTPKRIYQLTQPVPLRKVYVVIPDDLEATLDIILRTEKVPGSADWDVNLLQADFAKSAIVPVVCSGMHLGGDVNNWYQVADPKTRPGIEMAYLNNQRMPRVLVADMPTVGAMFTNDQIIYRVNHTYGGVVVDPFSLYAAIVAG